jgi:hypothetical protein
MAHHIRYHFGKSKRVFRRLSIIPGVHEPVEWLNAGLPELSNRPEKSEISTIYSDVACTVIELIAGIIREFRGVQRLGIGH